MNQVYLLLGGNLGDVKATFQRAVRLIETEVGQVTLRSSLFLSEPWGFESEDFFINQVIKVSTPLNAFELLEKILEFETQLGRKRIKGEVSSRIIDLDILFFNQDIIKTPELQVPHPRLHLRRFTLLPLQEIAPGLVHPQLRTTVSELLKDCKDHSKVVKTS